MPLSRDSRSERKWKAYRRAEYRLKQALERIDWEEDVLMPEIESLKAGRAIANLPAGAAFDLEMVEVKANGKTQNYSATPDTDSKATPTATDAAANAPAASA